MSHPKNYNNLRKELYIKKRKYFLRKVTIDDEEKIQKLCERCFDYYELVEGAFPESNEGRSILLALPPNKNLEDKVVFGVFDETNTLIALVDMLKDYKKSGEWIIGLILIDRNKRGLGLGSAIHKILKKWISDCGGESIRIGVIKENIRAYSFWFSLGYREIERVEMKFKNKDHIVIVMNILNI